MTTETATTQQDAYNVGAAVYLCPVNYPRRRTKVGIITSAHGKGPKWWGVEVDGLPLAFAVHESHMTPA